MKTQIGYDGADASNVLDFAKHMAVYESYNLPVEEKRVTAEEALDYWIPSLRKRLLALKFENIRERLSHYLTLCSTVPQLDKVLWKAWTELPESHFQALRSEAVDRMKVIQKETVNGVFAGKIKGALQPEVLNLEPGFPAPSIPSPAQTLPPPAVPGLDPSAVAQCETALCKFTDFTKLLAYWESGSAPYKAHEGLRDAFRRQVLDMFMKAESQGEVDLNQVVEKTPAYLKTAEWLKALKTRFDVLIPF